MFIVLLRFSDNAGRAGELMAAHNAWIQRAFDDGVFLLAGGLAGRAGGGIVAHAMSRSDLEARLSADPFVAENVVRAEVVELAPAKADARLAFLLA